MKSLYEKIIAAPTSPEMIKLLCDEIEKRGLPVRKQSNQQRLSALLANIDNFSFPLAAHETVFVQWFLKIGDNAGGICFRVTAPAGAGGTAHTELYESDGTLNKFSAIINASGDNDILRNNGDPANFGQYWTSIWATIINGSTAGTVNLQFAQSVPHATASLVYADSVMLVTRV